MNNKTLIIIPLLIICFIQSNKANNSIEGKWISFEPYYMVGLIFDFETDSLSVKSIGIKQIKTYPYSITDENEITLEVENTTDTMGRIISQSDSMFSFISAGNDTCRLFKLGETKIFPPSLGLKQILENNAFEVSLANKSFRIDFTNQPHPLGKGVASEGVIHLSNKISKSTEKWGCDMYENQAYIHHTFLQCSSTLYVINSYDNQNIYATSFLDGVRSDATLQLIPVLSESELKRKREIIGSKTWTLTNLDTTYNGKGASSFWMDTLFNYNDLKDRPVITYDFKDGIMQKKVDGQIFETEKWHLSSDGRYIYFNGNVTEKCIEIVSIENEKLKLIRNEMVKFDSHPINKGYLFKFDLE